MLCNLPAVLGDNQVGGSDPAQASLLDQPRNQSAQVIERAAGGQPYAQFLGCLALSYLQELIDCIRLEAATPYTALQISSVA